MFWLLCSQKPTNPLLPPLKHNRDYQRLHLHSGCHGLFWFTTERIMNDNRLLCCQKVLVVTSYVSAPHRAGPSLAFRATKLQISLRVYKYVWFLYCAKSTVPGRRSFASNAILQKALHCLTSFNPFALPQADSSTTCCPSRIQMFHTCYSDLDI